MLYVYLAKTSRTSKMQKSILTVGQSEQQWVQKLRVNTVYLNCGSQKGRETKITNKNILDDDSRMGYNGVSRILAFNYGDTTSR